MLPERPTDRQPTIWRRPNSRWPRFAAEAIAAGFRSVHALPLRLRGFVIGALNLLHIEPGHLQRPNVDAAHGAGRCRHDRHPPAPLPRPDAQVVTAQLNHALSSRIVIEQAKGIIAERKGLDMDQAFCSLRRYARTHNLRLADVARDPRRHPFGGRVLRSSAAHHTTAEAEADRRDVTDRRLGAGVRGYQPASLGKSLLKVGRSHADVWRSDLGRNAEECGRERHRPGQSRSTSR